MVVVQKVARCNSVYPYMFTDRCTVCLLHENPLKTVWCGEIIMIKYTKWFSTPALPTQDRKRDSGNFSTFCCPVKVALRHQPTCKLCSLTQPQMAGRGLNTFWAYPESSLCQPCLKSICLLRSFNTPALAQPATLVVSLFHSLYPILFLVLL